MEWRVLPLTEVGDRGGGSFYLFSFPFSFPFSFSFPFLMEQNKLRFMFVKLKVPATPPRESSRWIVVLWVWAAGELEEDLDLGAWDFGQDCRQLRGQ